MNPPESWYVVGLGNPGRRYRRTRHNLGFEVVEALVERWQEPRRPGRRGLGGLWGRRADAAKGGPRRAFGGLLWEAQFAGRRVRLLEPQTFMNESGRSVVEMVRFYRADTARLLVVLDDMALEPGVVRLRPRGSAGGHNGLADVLERLGTEEVPRLRLGIGGPTPGMDGVDYVLGRMSEDERAAAAQALETACRVVEDWLSEGIEAAMNRHN